MEVSRGDLVTVVTPGDYGKPRPALVVQSDAFAEVPSLTVLPLTSDLQPTPLLRITVEPGPGNGLERVSQVMVDKALTVPRSKIGRRIGQVGSATIREVGSALAVFLGLV